MRRRLLLLLFGLLVLFGPLVLFASSCTASAPEGGVRAPIEARVPVGEAGHVELTVAATDGTLSYVQGWRTRGAAQATILVVHDVGEESDGYAAFGKWLSKRGWPAYAIDLRGHGRSQGPRRRVDRFERFVGDVEAAIVAVRARETNAPLVLIGHGVGAVVAALVAERPGAGIDGLVLTAPALDDHPFAACATSLVADFSPHAPFVDVDIGGGLVAEASQQALREAPFIRVPTLVVHGDKDDVADPIGSRRFVDHIRSEQKALRLHEGAGHDLWRAGTRDRVAADVSAFIESLDVDPIVDDPEAAIDDSPPE